MRSEGAEAIKVVKALLHVLPDVQRPEKCWNWAWEELSGDAQEEVKLVREAASNWLEGATASRDDFERLEKVSALVVDALRLHINCFHPEAEEKMNAARDLLIKE